MKKTRKCQYCGKVFSINSGSQKFCCEACAEAAKRERKKKVVDFMRAVEPVGEVSRQEYLTFSKAAVLMGCSRQYIYKLVNNGKLPASRLSSRMSLVRRADIEKMLEGNPYHRVLPFAKPSDAGKKRKVMSSCNPKTTKSMQAVEPMEYYSGAEVMEKYKVKQSWLYVCAKKAQIPICKIAGRAYYGKAAIDEHFGATVDLSGIDEWLTTDEVAELFDMAKTAVRSYVYRHHIPTKREFGVTYYSKLHFDELRRTDLINDERYCTVEDVAKAYGMTTSNVCIIVKKNDVERKKVGVKWLLLRTDIERIMAERVASITKNGQNPGETQMIVNDGDTGASFSSFAPTNYKKR